MSDDGTERRLSDLVMYHTGFFTAAVTALESGDPAVVAHALFLLAEEAQRQRRRWLQRQDQG